MEIKPVVPHTFKVVATRRNSASVNRAVGAKAVVVYPSRGLQGDRGPAGGAADIVAAIPLSGHRAVTTDDAGKLIYADAGTLAHMNRGVWLTAAAWNVNDVATVVVQDLIVEPTWTWTLGQPIYLGLNGALVQSVPGSAEFIRILGDPVSSTSMSFSPRAPIRIGA